jgi:hypothetical protein
MANITVAPGGGVLADGVITYLPSCSAFSYGDISLESAEAYDITDSNYLQVGWSSPHLLPAAQASVLRQPACCANLSSQAGHVISGCLHTPMRGQAAQL